MRPFPAFIVILLLFPTTLFSISNQLFGCGLYIGNDYYNLKNLSSSSDYVYNSSLWGDKILSFNLCQKMNNPCSSGTSIYAKINYTNTSTCKAIATGFDINSFSLLNDTFNSSMKMLTINYANYSTSCLEDSTKNYSTMMYLHCNPSAVAPLIFAEKFDCNIRIDITSSNACSELSIGILWQILEQDKIALALILMILGAIISFFGQRLFKPTLFLLGTLAVAFILVFCAYQFVLTANTSNWVFYVVLTISILIGAVIGYILFKFTKYGIFLMGAWFGFVLIMILWSLIIHQICNSNQIVLIILLFIGVIGCAIASYYFRRQVILVSTSYVGSYLCLKGLGILVGGFPNEFTLYQQIKNGDLSTWNSTIYIYLAGIIILGTVALIYQEKNQSPKDKDFDANGDSESSSESSDDIEMKTKDKYKKLNKKKKKKSKA